MTHCHTYEICIRLNQPVAGKYVNTVFTSSTICGATLYDEFEEHGINGCAENKTTLKCAKNHGNWSRHFEVISRKCEPSNVVAYFFDPPCI